MTVLNIIAMKLNKVQPKKPTVGQSNRVRVATCIALHLVGVLAICIAVMDRPVLPWPYRGV